jgi:hypothetical protein
VAKRAEEDKDKDAKLEGDEPKEDAMEDEDEGAESEDDDEDAADDDPDEEAEDEEDDDDEPDAARATARRASRARAPRSLAELAGLPVGASTPAIKAALVPYVALARHVMTETGSRSPDAARGALKAIMADAGAAGELRTKLSAERRRNNHRERMALLRKLQAADIHPRGDLFVDVVDEKTGARTVKAARIYGEMKLATLRQYVATKLKGAEPRRGPATPDGEALQQGATAVTKLDREIAERGGYDPAKVAASRRALFGGASRGA